MDHATDIRAQIAALEKLPPLPEMARRLLQLKAKPAPSARELSAAVEMDPSLAAQVIRYARSSLYGYRGCIGSVDNAIARVLGYEMVLNLALGLAASRPFDLPEEGPLGARNYWITAVRTAFTAQKLAFAAPSAARGNTLPSMVYLSGLLHEFGWLVLSHLAPSAYHELNDTLTHNPKLDIETASIEQFGISHFEAGARAMRFWDLPDELVVTALKYPDATYDGPHHAYATIVRLAHLLVTSATAAEALEKPGVLAAMETLKLHREVVQRLVENLAEHTSDVDSLARQLAA